MIEPLEIQYAPTPLQKIFHESEADEVLFGGAAGGGKTTAIVADAIYRSINHAGICAYVFRRTYRELEDVLVPAALALLPIGVGKYTASDHEITFVNGSVLRFRHCFSASDVFRYQGAEMNYLYIDELTHFPKNMYDYLKTRLRANVALDITPKVRCTSNPGGIGHAWVKKRFIDAAPPLTEICESQYSEYLKKEKAHTRLYIPATVRSNPYIQQDYVFELEKKPELLRKALLDGDWNVFEGQAFPEWRDNPGGYHDGRLSHVIHPFKIPSGWRIYRSFDFGYAKPFSVLWWAVDFDDTVYLVHEWYGASDANVGLRLSVAEIAVGIKQRESELFAGRQISGPADPSIWDASRGTSVAEQLEQQGVYFQKGINARLSG
ncbi:MAG: phage terminase large subunit, partial [Eubacteriales bacterium]